MKIYSQSSLQDYVDCARRYQLRHLDHLKWPAVETEPLLERERHMQQGALFHQMIHQHLAGIPVEYLNPADEPLRRWWQAYLAGGLAGLPAHRYPELTLQTTLAGARLVARFDLVAVQPGTRAVIVDWKTAAHRTPHRHRMQTLVYRYVLATSGAHLNDGQPFAPEQIEMRYWFADDPHEPETLAYDSAQFSQDESRLRDLITEIETRQDFPLTPDLRRCAFCVYRSLCDRGLRAGTDPGPEAETDIDTVAAPEFTFDFDQIAEIEF